MSSVPWDYVPDACVQWYPKRGEKELVIGLFFQMKKWNKDGFLLGSFMIELIFVKGLLAALYQN